MSLRAVASISFFAACSLACQVLVSSDVVQCKSDSDCTNRGGAFVGMRCEEQVCRASSSVADSGADDASTPDAIATDPKWGCLGTVTWPQQSATEKVLYRQRFTRLIGATPIVGVHVKACASLDPECKTPLAEADTDAKGDVVVSVPRHFRGYLHMPVAPDSFREMAPTIYAIYPPPESDANLTAEPQVGTVPILVSLSELDFLLAQVKSSTDPNLGHLFGLTTDCSGNPTSGVSLRTAVRDPKTVQYYYEGNGTPSVTAQESDATGNAGFLNLPTGVISMETQVPKLAKKAGSYSVLVKKGSVTVIDFAPTP